MHFSLVKMNPEDAPPSHGFDDAILPLYYALGRLGYQVEILFNTINPQSRNIIFGSCIAPRRIGRMLPHGSIIFNLEQINPGSMWCNKDYLGHLRDFPVWDYSLSNIRALEGFGIAGAVHLPLGYVPEMTRLNPDYPGNVDLLFYGLLTERRDLMIRRLVAEGIHVLASQAAFGDLRDRLLAHSRLVLNLHQACPARLEVVRLGYVWANQKPVVSEFRQDTEIPAHLLEACVFAEYEAIPETVKKLLAEPALLKAQAKQAFRAFASKPMTVELEKIVGRRLMVSGEATSPARNQGVPAPYHIREVREWLI